jgi:hypothetical protein
MALSAMKDDRFHCTGKHEKFIGEKTIKSYDFEDIVALDTKWRDLRSYYNNLILLHVCA